jgi:hypothetical protein
MIKLDNHRLLKTGEIIRKGDFYKNKHNGEIRPVKFSINREVGSGGYANYDFYRRKHTKKVAPVHLRQRHPTIEPVTKKIPPAVTVVAFTYPHDHLPVTRNVQVISLDDKYLTGLEIIVGRDKPKYTFKRFLRSKMRTEMKLIHYGPNTK